MILATGYYAEEMSEQAAAAGISDILSKPFTATTLGHSLATTLYKRDDSISSKDAPATNLPDAIQGAPILLVEDNEINQQVALELLKSQGFKVDIAEHGQAALDAIEQKQYALVLMDIQMPVMDGLTAAKKIRSYYDYKQLPDPRDDS